MALLAAVVAGSAMAFFFLVEPKAPSLAPVRPSDTGITDDEEVSSTILLAAPEATRHANEYRDAQSSIPTSEPPSIPAPDYSLAAGVGERLKTPDEEFEAKYGHLTVAELSAEKAFVAAEWAELSQQLSDERFSAGLYEEFLCDPVDLEDPNAKMNLPSWPHAKSLSKAQRTIPTADGRVRVQRTIFPAAEYPYLYYKKDELSWMNRRIYKMKSGDL